MEMNRETFREEVKKFRTSFQTQSGVGAFDTAEKSIRLEKRGPVIRDRIGIRKAIRTGFKRPSGLLDVSRLLQRLGKTPLPVLVRREYLHRLPVARDRLIPFLLVPELLSEERPPVVEDGKIATAARRCVMASARRPSRCASQATL